jgi:hypothetical protein
MFFALILAACGGGSSPQVRGLVFTRANDDTPANDNTPAAQVFVLANDGTYVVQTDEGRTLIEDAAESLQSLAAQKAFRNLGISITIESITVTSDSTVDIVMSASNGAKVITTMALSGPDASLIRLVQKGPKNYEAVFKEPVDYDAPQDHNYDNVYEYAAVARIAGRPVTTNYRIEILDKQDGPTTVSPSAPLSGPDFERDGTEIKVTLEEGQDLVFEQFTGDNSASGTLSGADADKFEVETVSKSGKNVTKISFKEAPDASNHQDQGSDGVYNFEIDGALEQLWGDLQFEVTVVDVV